jgi:fatty acid desaturase
MRGANDTAPAASDIRRSLRRALPDRVFMPRPSRGLWFAPLVAVAVAGTALLASDVASAPARLLAVLVVGNTYASMLLLAHEVMHGGVLRSRRAQDALAWLGFAPFLVSPTLWRTWHNEVHHRHANESERDPDTFAGEAIAGGSAWSRRIVRLVPGAGGATSFVFPFVWFAAHGQIVLWFLSRRMPGFERMNRRRCKLEAGAMAAGWLALAVLLGPRTALLAIVAPMAVGNWILMSYIATNHLLRPLSERSDPLRGAMSVKTLGVLDRSHFRFSHHVEHHLFPAMTGRDLPLVREWLATNAGDAFVCVGHARALRALYATPRTYRDATTLVDLRRPSRAPVDLDVLARDLVGGRSAASGPADDDVARAAVG